MLKKTITCEDFDGNKYTDDYYFHLNKAELSELQLSKVGGLYAYAKNLASEDTNENREEMLKLYKDIILNSYGKKSADGKRFVKTKEMAKEFSETNAFESLYVELLTDKDAFIDFCRGIMPKEMSGNITAENVEKEMKNINLK